MSISTGRRATRSIQYFATMPAKNEVPQAMIVTLGTAAGSNGRSGRWTDRVAGLR